MSKKKGIIKWEKDETVDFFHKDSIAYGESLMKDDKKHIRVVLFWKIKDVVKNILKYWLDPELKGSPESDIKVDFKEGVLDKTFKNISYSNKKVKKALTIWARYLSFQCAINKKSYLANKGMAGVNQSTWRRGKIVISRGKTKKTPVEPFSLSKQKNWVKQRSQLKNNQNCAILYWRDNNATMQISYKNYFAYKWNKTLKREDFSNIHKLFYGGVAKYYGHWVSALIEADILKINEESHKYYIEEIVKMEDLANKIKEQKKGGGRRTKKRRKNGRRRTRKQKVYRGGGKVGKVIIKMGVIAGAGAVATALSPATGGISLAVFGGLMQARMFGMIGGMMLKVWRKNKDKARDLLIKNLENNTKEIVKNMKLLIGKSLDKKIKTQFENNPDFTYHENGKKKDLSLLFWIDIMISDLQTIAFKRKYDLHFTLELMKLANADLPDDKKSQYTYDLISKGLAKYYGWWPRALVRAGVLNYKNIPKFDIKGLKDSINKSKNISINEENNKT
tara:strand:+ start:4669 stop:6183 length:1515 start_codon:yes stop_codon:yes gene_type:complete